MGKSLIINNVDFSHVAVDVVTVYKDMIIYDKLMSDGNAYINTGVVLTENDVLTIEAGYNELIAKTSALFGWRNEGSSGGQSGNTMVIKASNFEKYRIFVGNGADKGTYEKLGKRTFVIDYKTGKAFVDGNEIITADTASSLGTVSLALFGFNTYDNSVLGILGNEGFVSSCKVERNNTTIIDLVPCYNKPQGIYGMFDKVSKTFIGPTGNGSFTVAE